MVSRVFERAEIVAVEEAELVSREDLIVSRTGVWALRSSWVLVADWVDCVRVVSREDLTLPRRGVWDWRRLWVLVADWVDWVSVASREELIVSRMAV
jgi:hypothetical protein